METFEYFIIADSFLGGSQYSNVGTISVVVRYSGHLLNSGLNLVRYSDAIWLIEQNVQRLNYYFRTFESRTGLLIRSQCINLALR